MVKVKIGDFWYSDKNLRKVDYECIYKKQKCKATAKRDNPFSQNWILSDDHTCQLYYARRKARALSKKQIQEPGLLSVKISNRDVFNSVVLNNADVTGKVKYGSVSRTLRRYKKAVKPKVPLTSTKNTTIKDLFEKQFDKLQDHITYPVQKENKIIRIIHVTSKSNGETYHHLIFYDPDFVSLFTTESWDMDGTFDSRPNLAGVEQLYTVMAIKEVEIEVKVKKVVQKKTVRKPVGLFYALTSNRTTETYVSIFQYMKTTFPALKPNSAMSDYEGAPRNAIQIVFPSIILLGCWFHHNQASMRQGVLKKVADSRNNKRNNPQAHRQLKKFQALPLLPVQKMQEGFDIVRDETREMYKTYYINDKLEWTYELNEFWENYFTYHYNEWFKRVKPENVCVYRCLEKTNNFCENAHRHYPKYLGTRKQIDAWIGGLASMMALDWVKLKDMEKGNIDPPRKSAHQLKRDKLIENCWEKYEAGTDDYGVKEFLNEVSTFEVKGNTPSFPKEAQTICVTYGSYVAKKFAFTNSNEQFSAEELFNAPIIYTNDMEQAKKLCAVSEIPDNPNVFLKFTQ